LSFELQQYLAPETEEQENIDPCTEIPNAEIEKSLTGRQFAVLDVGPVTPHRFSSNQFKIATPPLFIYHIQSNRSSPSAPLLLEYT
jgi:hypothetical protein